MSGHERRGEDPASRPRLAAAALSCLLAWAGLAGVSLAANAERPDIAPPAPPPGLDLSRAPEIPLVDGLVVVTAVADERGDYESVKRVSRGPERLLVSYSATVAVAGVPTEVRGARAVLDKDLKSARSYRIAFRASPVGGPPQAPELVRGSTALGLSTEVFEELRADGRSECSLASIEEAGALIGALGLPSPEYEGLLERVGTAAVAVPVVLDGERHWLPAIHAKGWFEGLVGEFDAELWILDNPRNPLALRFAIGDRVLKVMRIDRPPGAAASRVEQALTDRGQADLPGVYFEFASARLRPESEAAIAEVTDVLRRHPAWRVRIEGHTDDVGGDEPNLTLSRQRAEAVRAAILAHLGTGGERLETAGFGAAQPRESNRTPEGRARNRRVEIRSLR